MSATTPIRWGILGTAQIARKNWHAIRNSGNGVVRAVASRRLERSRSFIEECQACVPFAEVPRALASYEALLAAEDIDAVYIPLPTGLRAEWVIKAAEAGKHVVCEKPCAVRDSDLRAMTEACAKHQVQFMDGVMFMHNGRLAQIREVLAGGEPVGLLHRMSSGFSFRAPDEFFGGNIRAHSDLEPFGCLGDLGWYCLRFFLFAMDYQLPAQVSGRLLATRSRPDSPRPVPTQFSAEMFWAGGPSATFYVSFETENQQWVHLAGTRGYLRVDDFVLPWFGSQLDFEVNQPEFVVNGCDFSMERRSRIFSTPEHSNNHRTAQETLLFRHFGRQVLSGELNPEWPDIAVKTQRLMNACYESALANRPVDLD